jgi:hypothetical protein
MPQFLTDFGSAMFRTYVLVFALPLLFAGCNTSEAPNPFQAVEKNTYVDFTQLATDFQLKFDQTKEKWNGKKITIAGFVFPRMNEERESQFVLVPFLPMRFAEFKRFETALVRLENEVIGFTGEKLVVSGILSIVEDDDGDSFLELRKARVHTRGTQTGTATD